MKNLNQEELIKRINMLEEKNKKQVNILSEQLNWYSQQIKLQQRNFLVRHQKKQLFLIRFFFVMKLNLNQINNCIPIIVFQ